ncbi:MAG: histidine phosphatase family protein [Actinobacteria bacterium]|nr:MAG: histidine phosphatase family protein [Actinomycetota bacterium]
MKQLELRRHAPRDPAADRLSEAGRARAMEVGRAHQDVAYVAVFVSPAERAAETVAWFLRGAGQQLPQEHSVVPGLAGKDQTEGSPEGMAIGIRSLLEQLPEGGRGLAISHTPFVERAALGLTGHEVEPMRECEGLLITLRDDGDIEIEELRLPGSTAG